MRAAARGGPGGGGQGSQPTVVRTVGDRGCHKPTCLRGFVGLPSVPSFFISNSSKGTVQCVLGKLRLLRSPRAQAMTADAHLCISGLHQVQKLRLLRSLGAARGGHVPQAWCWYTGLPVGRRAPAVPPACLPLCDPGGPSCCNHIVRDLRLKGCFLNLASIISQSWNQTHS